MKSNLTCSLVTPTYNWPEALELLLLSIKKQSILPNEVIIADEKQRGRAERILEKSEKAKKPTGCRPPELPKRNQKTPTA